MRSRRSRIRNKTRSKQHTQKQQKSQKGRGQHIPIIVDIRQIMITQPIITEIRKMSPTKDISMFKLEKGFQGFPLPRIYNQSRKNIHTNLEQYPIEVSKSPYGAPIDGVKKQLYSIVNGRHRFMKAILENLKEVPVIITY